jgi:hypothetical protein
MTFTSRSAPDRGAVGLDAAIMLASVVAAALLFAVWTLPADALVRRFFWDDSFYYLETARNIVATGLVSFDGRNLTNGFHPLWMAILLPVCALARNDRELIMRGTLTLQILGFLLPSLILVWRITARWFGPVAALAGFAAALFLFPSRQLDGMEAGLLVLLGMLLALRLSADRPPAMRETPGARLVTGVLLGLIFLARTDCVFMIAAWGAVALWTEWRERRDRGAVRALAGAVGSMIPTGLVIAALAVPYLAWNFATFAAIVPISGAVKYHFAQPDWVGAAVPTVTKVMVALIAAAWLVGIAVLAGRIRRRETLPGSHVCLAVLGLFVIAHYSFTVLRARWGVSPWHFSLYAVPFVFVIAWAARTVERLAARAIGVPWGPRLAAAAGVVLVLAALGKDVWRYGRAFDAFTAGSLRAGLWTQTHLPPQAHIGMKDCGVYGYFADRSVTNLDGIINNYAYQRYLAQGRFADYVRDQGIGYIAQHVLTRFPAAASPGYGSIVYTLPIYPHGGQVTLFEKDEVYRTSWSADGDAQFVIWRLRPDSFSAARITAVATK